MVPPAQIPPDTRHHGTSSAIEFAVRGSASSMSWCWAMRCAAASGRWSRPRQRLRRLRLSLDLDRDCPRGARSCRARAFGPPARGDHPRRRAGRRPQQPSEPDELPLDRREGRSRHAQAARLVVQHDRRPALCLQSGDGYVRARRGNFGRPDHRQGHGIVGDQARTPARRCRRQEAGFFFSSPSPGGEKDYFTHSSSGTAARPGHCSRPL